MPLDSSCRAEDQAAAQQRSLVEGCYYRPDGMERLAESSGRTVAATYRALQWIRRALQVCIENAGKPEGVAP